MTAPARKAWTQDEFFAFAEAQGTRYEFDGFEPVAMTGGTLRHNVVAGNILTDLRVLLRGTSWRPFIFAAGVATARNAVRYPDVVVSCGPVSDAARLLPGPVVVFEVISPTSIRMDRVIKLREYATVSSIRRYVIVETDAIGLTIFHREAGEQPWTASALDRGDILRLPEIRTELSVEAIYADTDFGSDPEH